MERFLFLMIPLIWGGLVLGLGHLAMLGRKRYLHHGVKALGSSPDRDTAEKTEEAFY